MPVGSLEVLRGLAAFMDVRGLPVPEAVVVATVAQVEKGDGEARADVEEMVLPAMQELHIECTL